MKCMAKNALHAAKLFAGLLAVPMAAMTVRFAIYAPYFMSLAGE